MKSLRSGCSAALTVLGSLAVLSAASGCSQGQDEPGGLAEATNTVSMMPSDSGETPTPSTPVTVSPAPNLGGSGGQAMTAPSETGPSAPSSTPEPSSTMPDAAGGGGGMPAPSSTGPSDVPVGVGGAAPVGSMDAGTVEEPEPEPLPPGDCTNNRRDGDEEGVDCGGSCEPCVDYDVGPPPEGNEDRSGCEANGDGFMCAQSMVFAPSMKQAAGDDWGAEEPPFVYGVVGHDPDSGGVDAPGASYSSACCQCYQLVFKAPMDASVEMAVPKPMIVQGFNTYAGGPSAFDIYMAAGGHGNFNGCTANGTQYSGYPDLGGDWTGGVRATRYSQCASEGVYSTQSVSSATCQEYIAGQCGLIAAQEPTQSISQQSCVDANRADAHYHINWYVAVKRVECPENLTKVTGCRLGDQGLPQADPSITTFDAAIAAGFGERSPNATDGQDPLYHTTTMQDCCRPTCAWDANTSNTTGGYNRFFTCNHAGSPR